MCFHKLIVYVASLCDRQIYINNVDCGAQFIKLLSLCLWVIDGAATTAMNNQQCIMYTMRLYIQTLCLYCQFFPKIFFEFSSILCEFLIKTCRQVAQCMRNTGQWNENIVTISHCKELSHIVSAWDMTWLKIRLSYQSTKYFNVSISFFFFGGHTDKYPPLIFNGTFWSIDFFIVNHWSFVTFLATEKQTSPTILLSSSGPGTYPISNI